MVKTYVISDLHLSHVNAYNFLRDDGTKMRPWAKDWQEGDERIIAAWNSTVNPEDKVYVLGDVAIPRKGLKLLSRMNGKKKELVFGNHDIFRDKDYTEHFNRLHGMLKKDVFILTHYPIHPDSIPSWCVANIHGHIHYKVVKKWNHEKQAFERDERYINVSIEQLPDLKPIDLEDIKKGWRNT